MAEGQGRSSGQGVKLLYIRDYLYAEATPAHPKNAKHIQAFLASKGIAAVPKTIYNDITLLKYDFGVPVEYDHRKHGYYISKPLFEPYELRLMVDCVQAAPFITEKEAQNITNKIKGFANVYDRESLNRQAYVKDRIFRVDDSVVRKADILHTALQQKRQISFRYFTYVGKRTERKEYLPGNHGDIFIVNPKRMVWENGTYLLETYQNTFGGVTFFVERMTNIKILSTPCITKVISRLKEQPFPDEISDMIFGKTHVVTLRIRNEAASMAFACWGRDIVTVPEGKYYFTVSLKVRLNKDFYAQIASMGCYVKILRPQEALDGFDFFRKELNDLYEKDVEPMTVWSQEEIDQYEREFFDALSKQFPDIDDMIPDEYDSEAVYPGDIDEDVFLEDIEEFEDVTGGHMMGSLFLD